MTGSPNFAYLTMIALSATTVCLSSGCLVIDQVEVPPEEDCVSEILSDLAVPQPGFIQPIRVDEDDFTEFTVPIRDCSPTQRLEGTWVLDFVPDLGAQPRRIREDNIDPSERDTYTFRLMHTALEGAGEINRCRRLQLFVTPEFRFGTIEPVVENDLVTETWFLGVQDRDLIEFDQDYLEPCLMGGQ